MLHSCQNCWHNGLQYDALGLQYGYCVMHRKMLIAADSTTCGQHMRKDLPLRRAQEVSKIHLCKYTKQIIVDVNTNEASNMAVSPDAKNIILLQNDPVGELVSDFGMLDSKIESLAQLKTLKSVRAEVAMISLARGYINTCMSLDGNWTSGLHLYWWTKKRLPEIPVIAINDLRTSTRIDPARQVILTTWSVVMLRLTLIDDIVQYAAAQDDPISGASGLLQKAAEAVQTFNLQKLSTWMKNEAIPILDKKLSAERYIELSKKLHKEKQI